MKDYRLAYQYFLWNFLSLQGYKSEANECAICHLKLNPYYIYFSSKEGGVVCKNCSVLDEDVKKINSDVAKILRLILKKDWHTVSKLKVGTSSQKLLEDISENTIRTFCPAHC